MAAQTKKRIVILGSTGSVGTQALDVVRQMPDRFDVVGLSCCSHWQLVAEQAAEFEPEAIAVTDPAGAERLAGEVSGRQVELLAGVDGLKRLAGWEGADLILSAVSGSAGIPAAVAALESGRTLALANKESVVACGSILMDLARENGTTILPVDSEHSALFQLLRGVSPGDVDRAMLTASGGPFYGMSAAEMAQVTPEQAVRHPIWQMGRKISVDSATLMNKALEVVEARWLFGLPAEKIQVCIHPQSVVHCILHLRDGACLAHMAVPDLRLSIQYALSYPERMPPTGSRLNLAEAGDLGFYEPDYERFPALAVGYRVAEVGGTSGAVMSAADEVAVEAFLSGRIGFTDIVPVVQRTLDRHEVREVTCLQDVMDADRWAREEARRCLESL